MTTFPSKLIVPLLVALIAALSACGGGPSDPLWDQLKEDVKSQNRTSKPAKLSEAFVSSFTDDSGASAHATCITYGKVARPQRSIIYRPGSSLEIAGRDTPEWGRYCAAPVTDAAGKPVLQRTAYAE